jgi:hypothetical protein
VDEDVYGFVDGSLNAVLYRNNPDINRTGSYRGNDGCMADKGNAIGGGTVT